MSITLKAAIHDYLADCYIRGLKDKSISSYETQLQPLVRFLGSDLILSHIDRGVYIDYVTHLRARGLSSGTLASYIRMFRLFVSWCNHRPEYQTNLPASEIKIPKSPKKFVHILTDDEILTLFQNCRPNNGSEWIYARNKLLISLMLDSGLRVFETCNICLSDISDKKIMVHGKGEKDRIVPLGSRTHKLLVDYLSLRPYSHEYVICSRTGARMTTDAIKHMIYKLDSRCDFHVSCHVLRHNFATNYCLDSYRRSGSVDIYSLMLLMGHSELSTTERYMHHARQLLAAESYVSHLDNVEDKENLL